MSRFLVQGWCPGALRPMLSGDGLVVRIRPDLGRLTPAQARGIADAARAFGNGQIDLSARGNVQLRGVSDATHPALIEALTALGLIDPDSEAEQRRNILVTPFADAETLALAAQMQVALAQMPALAARIGNTRSAAAVELWRPHLAGAVVAIGNAPTALFHLLNMLEDPDCPRPAAIIGCPVGFIGAAESKAALMAAAPVPAVVVEGRLGGSAITVAAVNALASRKE